MSYKSLAVLAVLNVSPCGTRLFQDRHQDRQRGGVKKQDRQDRQGKYLLAVLKNSQKH